MAKKKIFILLIIGTLFSCKESFTKIDHLEFNKEIQNQEFNIPEEIIKAFYNYPEEEGKPNLEIKTEKKGSLLWEVTLIHSGQQDDSQEALKIVMTLSKVNNSWVIQSIKKNRRCYEGRGHTYWGTEWCN